ncbi:MAG TPA: hypothetical protein VF540_05540 [Segetibacter sp.]
MEESYNSDPQTSGTPKTSSTDSKSNSKTTGDSQVQDGIGVENQEEKSYEKSDEQQEYLEQANNNTAAANESPVQDGKGMTMLAGVGNDEEDDDDEDDDPLTEIEIGDDPAETNKKLPVM